MWSERVLIFGGTGSLGHALVSRLTELGCEVCVFSRDEDKHFRMKKEFPKIRYFIGDVRDQDSILKAIQDFRPTSIINAAAMKQVPICEDFPWEAVKTNTVGTHNVVRAVEKYKYNQDIASVISVSTDKACDPINSYGMTKALQERIHVKGIGSVFNCVRYGNILESTGSVIPFFKAKLDKDEEIPVTHMGMTRFFLGLGSAVDLIFSALSETVGGKIFIPKVRSAYISDLAEVLCEYKGKNRDCIKEVGIRPGEKIHEVLISQHEVRKTEDYDDVYVINLNSKLEHHDIEKPYTSDSRLSLMSYEDLKIFLEDQDVI